MDAIRGVLFTLWIVCVGFNSVNTTCTDVPAVSDGTIAYSTGSTDPHATDITATLTCDGGYTLTGTAILTCAADTTWGGSHGTCDPNDCADATVTGGAVAYSATPHTSGSTARVTCTAGYTVSVTGAITCTAGSWGAVLGCDPDNCADASAVTNGNAIVYSVTPHTSGSTATVSCAATFTLSASGTVTCTTGSWGAFPTCDAAVSACADATAVTNGNAIVYSATPHTSGSTATVTCTTGYTLSASGTVTCTAGSWGTFPTCNLNENGTSALRSSFFAAFVIALAVTMKIL